MSNKMNFPTQLFAYFYPTQTVVDLISLFGWFSWLAGFPVSISGRKFVFMSIKCVEIFDL